MLFLDNYNISQESCSISFVDTNNNSIMIFGYTSKEEIVVVYTYINEEHNINLYTAVEQEFVDELEKHYSQADIDTIIHKFVNIVKIAGVLKVTMDTGEAVC